MLGDSRKYMYPYLNHGPDFLNCQSRGFVELEIQWYSGTYCMIGIPKVFWGFQRGETKSVKP